MNDSVNLWQQDALVRRYNAHLDTPRGRVRTEVMLDIVVEMLEPQSSVLDVGGGRGDVALALVRRGHRVTLLEPSAAMVREAEALPDTGPMMDAQSFRIVEMSFQQAAGYFEPNSFDAVLCHGLLMYLHDPADLLAFLSGQVAPRGKLSILTKSDRALAMRPALQGRYDDALQEVLATHSDGWLGVDTRGDSPERLSAELSRYGFSSFKWYGVGTFSDHLRPGQPASELVVEQLISLEKECAGLDPYRQVARLFQLTGVRTN